MNQSGAFLVKNNTGVVWPQKSGRGYINLPTYGNRKIIFFYSDEPNRSAPDNKLLTLATKKTIGRE